MKVRTPTVLLPSFNIAKAFEESRDWYFPSTLQTQVFSRKFLSTLGYVTPEQ